MKIEELLRCSRSTNATSTRRAGTWWSATCGDARPTTCPSKCMVRSWDSKKCSSPARSRATKLELLTPIAQDREVRLSRGATQAVQVRGSRPLVVEALLNLQDDAIRSTPGGGGASWWRSSKMVMGVAVRRGQRHGRSAQRSAADLPALLSDTARLRGGARRRQRIGSRDRKGDRPGTWRAGRGLGRTQGREHLSPPFPRVADALMAQSSARNPTRSGA